MAGRGSGGDGCGDRVRIGMKDAPRSVRVWEDGWRFVEKDVVTQV